jgi:acyl-CoA dehydrogenase
MMVHGGMAFATGDLERKWRETRLFQTAPIATNLILDGIVKTELKS